MSASPPPETPPAEGEDAEKKSGGKKKLILIAVPVLLIAVGAGLWFTGILPNMLGMGKKDGNSQAPQPSPHFFSRDYNVVGLGAKSSCHRQGEAGPADRVTPRVT